MGAIISERFSEYYLKKNNKLQFKKYYAQAIDYYRKWGADKKVEQLTAQQQNPANKAN